MTDHFTAPDGARIAYDVAGEGPAVLCLAGLTRTRGDFDWLMPHLAGFRAIRMDYRGRGESDWSGPATYTVMHEAGDAVALLDHLGLERAAVVGTSRGGLVGMVMAATARARLSALALNDIGPEIGAGGLQRIIDYLGRNPVWKTHAEAAEAMPRVLGGFGPVPEGRWLAEVRRWYAETPEGLKITYDPALRDAFVAAFGGGAMDLWPLFDACAGLPMLLVRGANSDLLTPGTAAEMRRRRLDMGFVEVPGRAHVPFLDEPEVVGPLRAFLAAHA